MKRVMILNGPNLNMLGIREPHIYGSTTLDAIKASCEEFAAFTGTQLAFHQSNHEGVLVDTFQKHMDEAAGAILNPGGFTQYSVALHDCIKAMPFPVIEVHLSNVHARERFRRRSLIAPAARGQIVGLGWYGYLAALDALVTLARDERP